MTRKSSPSDYDRYARMVRRDDYWGQVRRVVCGKAVSEEQIGMIVRKVQNLLSLNTRDCLLDLGCGNGALSARFFDRIGDFYGVDESPYLIGIAKSDFRFENKDCYGIGEIEKYLESEEKPERFTKALIYAVIQHLPDEKVISCLHLLKTRFVNIEKIVIGNIQEREKAENVLVSLGITPSTKEIDDPDSMMGRWRTSEQISMMAQISGWNSTFSKMEEGFYASWFRYDALLTPKA